MFFFCEEKKKELVPRANAYTQIRRYRRLGFINKCKIKCTQENQTLRGKKKVFYVSKEPQSEANASVSAQRLELSSLPGLCCESSLKSEYFFLTKNRHFRKLMLTD